jgi:hypothetical protein
MASDYGVNFGFRRSDESMAIREGRLKVPTTGTFKQGDCVVFDTANAGFLTLGAAGEEAVSGWSGILVQEEVWDRSIYGVNTLDSFNLDEVLNNRLAAIWSGAGVKVWMRNTAEQVRADGRTIPAATRWVTTGVALGDYLGWNGTAWAKTTTAAEQFMRVTLVSGEYVEAVLIH